MFRKAEQRFMGVGADHDGIGIARQHARRIGDGLTASELQIGMIERQRATA